MPATRPGQRPARGFRSGGARTCPRFVPHPPGLLHLLALREKLRV